MVQVAARVHTLLEAAAQQAKAAQDGAVAATVHVCAGAHAVGAAGTRSSTRVQQAHGHAGLHTHATSLGDAGGGCHL